MEFNLPFASLSDGVAAWAWVLCLTVLTSLAAREKPRNHYSARRGNLVITVTKVETAEEIEEKSGASHSASKGYHFVVVHIELRNVGRKAQSTYLSPATLQASFGIEAHRLIGLGKEPEINELLPGERTEGSYTFELRDGVTPFKIVLSSFGPQPLKLDTPPPQASAEYWLKL